MKLITLFLLLVVVASSHVVAPALRIVKGGIELNVLSVVEGTEPLSYQWTRSRTVNGVTTVVQLPAEIGGTSPALTLVPPYTVGWYRCVISNSAGETTTDPVQILTTTSSTYPPITVTIKL